jgi:hypothetical protein
MIGKKKKLVIVEWIDSYSIEDSNRWQFICDMKKPKDLICISVGWILKETKKMITVVPHITDIKNKYVSGSHQGSINIPKKCIIKTKILKYKSL